MKQDEYLYGLMMEGWFYIMNSTTQWNILWNTALFPPQEMLPPDNLFGTHSCASTVAPTGEHLFGFTPCVLPLHQENDESVAHEQAMLDTYSTDNSYVTYEDFSALFAVEDLAAFI